MNKIFFFSLTCLLFSCSMKDVTKTYLLKPVKERTALIVNKKYYYTISKSISFTADAPQGNLTSASSSVTGIIYEMIPADSAGNRLIKFSFDKLHAETEKNDEKEVYDAENSTSTDRMDKMLRNIKGTTFVVTTDNAGNFVSFTGAEAMVTKVLADLNDLTPEDKETVKKRVQQLAGDGFLKENFEQLHKMLPDSAVKIGSKWTKTTTIPGEISLKTLTTFTLRGTNGDEASVTYESDITNTEKEALIIMGMPVNATIKGTEKGNLTVNLKTGMITGGESKVKLAGDISSRGTAIPITIEVKRKILLKEL